MFTKLVHFERAWQHESEATLKLLKELTDASLDQAVTPRDRTLGRMAWHLVTTIPEMMNRTGLAVPGPAHDAPPPRAAAEIAAAYEAAARSLIEQVKKGWTDETLLVQDDMYGQRWKRGLALSALITHQAHHRGQMTVLMRQAGLKVPGVYGPAREEWAALGAPTPEV
jgi:uncharacterized damage-inducible protein DinB